MRILVHFVKKRELLRKKEEKVCPFFDDLFKSP